MSRKFTFLLGVLGLILLPAVGSAQSWTPIHTFPGYLSFVKITDSHTLFVGLGVGPGGPITGPVGIWRSTDLGATWSECVIPTGYSGEVTDLVMTDAANGWATVIPWGGVGRDGLWKTTDGGSTWAETGLMGACTSIRNTPSAIVTTDIFGAGHTSLDGGISFFDGIGNSSNCVDFVDSLHGVSSNYRGQQWQVTTDGGVSWNPSSEVVESWSVYGVPNTSTFYAAPEGPTDGSPYTSVVLRSTDFGTTWNVQSTLPFVTTGTIVGNRDNELYIQVSNNAGANAKRQRDGIFRSTDHGATWTDLGGPGALSDSRFSVLPTCSGTTVFAFDSALHGTLYRLGMPGNGVYFAPYYSGSFGTKVNSDVSVPLTIRLPPSLDLIHHSVSSVRYTVTYDPNIVVAAGFAPGAGWKIGSYTPSTDHVDIGLTNIGSAAVGDSLYLGAVTMHALHGGSCPVRTIDLEMDIDSQTVRFCYVTEGNVSALVDVDEASGVESLATGQLEIQVGSSALIRSTLASGPVQLQLLDVTGRVLDTRMLEPTGTLMRYSPPNVAAGTYLLVLRQGNRSEVRKLTLP